MKQVTPSRSRKAEEPLASVLASRALAAIVIYFVLHPDKAIHFRALQRATGVSSRSLQHEMARLEPLGMVQRERDRRLVRYRAVDSHPRWSALRQMVREFTGPADLMRMVFADAPEIEAAFIFGSCARGEMDENSDIDVFVLGDLTTLESRFDYVGARMEASMILRREVNFVYYTRAKLEARRAGGFLRSVLARPKIWIVGGEHLLTSRDSNP